MLLSSDNLTLLSYLIGGGGIISGLVTLVTFRSSKDKTVVETSQAAVIVQKEVLEGLERENKRLREERDEARRECDEWEIKHDELERLYMDKMHALEGIIAAIDDRRSAIVVQNPEVQEVLKPKPPEEKS